MPMLRPRPERAEDADAVRVAAGHQRRPRRRADGLGDVEIGEPHPLGRHAVEVRRRRLGAEAADVGVAMSSQKMITTLGGPAFSAARTALSSPLNRPAAMAMRIVCKGKRDIGHLLTL